jgi:hypothetical protein
MSSHQRGGITAPRTFNRYPTAPDADGRGASTVKRAVPVGADPLAVGHGINDTAASQDFLKATRERLAKERT